MPSLPRGFFSGNPSVDTTGTRGWGGTSGGTVAKGVGRAPGVPTGAGAVAAGWGGTSRNLIPCRMVDFNNL